jgi:hypothetical protein
MEPTSVKIDRIVSESANSELAIPGFVEADQRNRELLAAHLENLRHNGEITGEENPDDWVDPIVAKKLFENWNRSIGTVPRIEELEARGVLELSGADRAPEWLDEAEIHEVMHDLALGMLDGDSEIEAVHPQSRVHYQISTEEMPNRRLAIAFAKLFELETEKGTRITKQAFVYEPATRRFVRHVIFRETSTYPLESRLDMGVQSDIEDFEGTIGPIELASTLRILAESDIIRTTRAEAA